MSTISLDIDRGEYLCGCCSHLIPSYIPEIQFKRYICNLLSNKYNHTPSFNPDGTLSRRSAAEVLDVVSVEIVTRRLKENN